MKRIQNIPSNKRAMAKANVNRFAAIEGGYDVDARTRVMK